MKTVRIALALLVIATESPAMAQHLQMIDLGPIRWASLSESITVRARPDQVPGRSTSSRSQARARDGSIVAHCPSG